MTAPRLSLADIQRAEALIDPVFRHSPQYLSEPLSQLLGCRVTVKVETQNPIRSFKGRGADWLLHQNTADQLVCASAGNFGQAIAYAARKRGVRAVIYASVNANPLKIERMRALGAEVVLFGEDFDAAKDEARRMACEAGLRFVEDSLDVETLVGAGTIGTELATLPYPLDALLVPLGNGALINGIGTAFKALSPATQIVAVQSEGAPAMIHSWQQGRLIAYDTIQTIADGIGVRVPVPQALEDMKAVVDTGLLVSEAAILEAIRLLHLHTGLVVEPSGAVGIAALLENRALFAEKQVGVIICGGNLTEEQLRTWLH